VRVGIAGGQDWELGAAVGRGHEAIDTLVREVLNALEVAANPPLISPDVVTCLAFEVSLSGKSHRLFSLLT